MKTDYIGWIFLVGIVLLVLELSFFDGGPLFSLAVSAALIYLGRKFKKRIIGKMMFYIGVFSMIITVLNMYFFKFFLLAILLYLLLSYYQSKKHPKWIKPLLHADSDSGNEDKKETIIKKNPLFENKLFGHQSTPDHVYEWDSINIQDAIGDAVVDLSNTILPKGDSVISIRKMAGNITVLVPYGVGIHVHHSVIAGRAIIFENRPESRVFNQLISCHTEDFGEAVQRIHIITSVIVGDLEVKRI
ncbi:cell wall-active antibiotics response protein LiaF [Bacillus massiliglaciei]|uniref:cell wall-active antibiotics response protein LiaF n=1 Tax=Bacillus massiliglaciei TaxID=1816693 RepID=UPI001F429AF2|nr:cell wall-active antibiotics response protein LiaF [Bacillus massiliglaciei]